MTALPLSATKKAILFAIRDFHEKNGYAPRYTEVGRMVGIGSRSTVHDHLVALKREGLVDYVPQDARTLVLTGYGRAVIERKMLYDGAQI